MRTSLYRHMESPPFRWKLYAMGFAAGAMVSIVAEDLIPESQRAGDTDLGTVLTWVSAGAG
jgi:zinc transporter ZupT